ncbi:MAG TPA: hypothetical protein VF208_07985 [Candidatus Binatia bacterium]
MISPNLSAKIRAVGVFAVMISLALTVLSSVARSQTIRSAEETARILAIEKLAVQDGVVTGEVRNNSIHALRDVQLFIRYTWLWDDERHPGKIDPGTSAYYTLNETIQPGGKINFTFKPSPPLPRIAGGRFDTSVKIAGFSEIIPQKQ